MHEEAGNDGMSPGSPTKVFINLQKELDEFLALENKFTGENKPVRPELVAAEIQVESAQENDKLNDSLGLDHHSERDKTIGDSTSTAGIISGRDKVYKPTDSSLYLTKESQNTEALMFNGPRLSHSSLGNSSKNGDRTSFKGTQLQDYYACNQPNHLSRRNMTSKKDSSIGLLVKPETKKGSPEHHPAIRPRQRATPLTQTALAQTPAKQVDGLLTKPLSNIDIRLSPSKQKVRGSVNSQSKLDGSRDKSRTEGLVDVSNFTTPQKAVLRSKPSIIPGASGNKLNHSSIKKEYSESEGLNTGGNYRAAYKLSEFYHQRIKTIESALLEVETRISETRKRLKKAMEIELYHLMKHPLFRVVESQNTEPSPTKSKEKFDKSKDLTAQLVQLTFYELSGFKPEIYIQSLLKNCTKKSVQLTASDISQECSLGETIFQKAGLESGSSQKGSSGNLIRNTSAERAALYKAVGNSSSSQKAVPGEGTRVKVPTLTQKSFGYFKEEQTPIKIVEVDKPSHSISSPGVTIIPSGLIACIGEVEQRNSSVDGQLGVHKSVMPHSQSLLGDAPYHSIHQDTLSMYKELGLSQPRREMMRVLNKHQNTEEGTAKPSLIQNLVRARSKSNLSQLPDHISPLFEQM